MTRIAWALYPLLVTFVIVATGNHFLSDAILGAVTAGLSAWAASWLARARPDRLGLRAPPRPDGHARADPRPRRREPGVRRERCATGSSSRA